MAYGDVYLKDPLDNDQLCWYDWCSYNDFVRRYANSFDTGRFLFVVA